MNERQLQALVKAVRLYGHEKDFWHLHRNGVWDYMTTDAGDCPFGDGPLALAVVVRTP